MLHTGQYEIFAVLNVLYVHGYILEIIQDSTIEPHTSVIDWKGQIRPISKSPPPAIRK